MLVCTVPVWIGIRIVCVITVEREVSRSVRSNNFNCHHMFLHAQELEFTHPFTNNNIIVKALFPEDWLKIFDEFNWELNL